MTAMRTPLHLRKPGYVRGPLVCQLRPIPTVFTRRVHFRDDHVSIWAWPSPGGLIVLEHATALDFDFLGLDRVYLPESRGSDQNAEDEFARRLLLLGAKWFDSLERYRFVKAVAQGDDRSIRKLEAKEELAPTRMERRWVRVALKNGVNADDGLWVLEFETNEEDVQENDGLPDDEAAHVDLAMNMDEKCKILENLGASFYSTLGEYNGEACLNMWERKIDGKQNAAGDQNG